MVHVSVGLNMNNMSGGKEYTFILKSGEKITSDDVWIQGKIQEELKNILVML